MIGHKTQSNLSKEMKHILCNLFNYPTKISLYDYITLFHGLDRDQLQGNPTYLSIGRSFRRLHRRGLVTKSKDFHTVSYGLTPKGIEVVQLEI